MTGSPALSDDNRTLSVRVPLAIRKRGGRKLVVVPDGAMWPPPRPHVDNAMIKALARAHRWKNLLENGQFESVAELARSEKINQSYVYRLLRLVLLAPDIVEMILDGRQSSKLQLGALVKPIPAQWDAQRKSLVG